MAEQKKSKKAGKGSGKEYKKLGKKEINVQRNLETEASEMIKRIRHGWKRISTIAQKLNDMSQTPGTPIKEFWRLDDEVSKILNSIQKQGVICSERGILVGSALMLMAIKKEKDLEMVKVIMAELPPKPTRRDVTDG